MVAGVAVAVRLYPHGTIDNDAWVVVIVTVAPDGEGEDVHSIIGGSELGCRGAVCIPVVGHNIREFGIC